MKAVGGWWVAAALASALGAYAPRASADVSIGVDVAPEITIGDPQEVTIATEPPDPVYEERTDLPGPGYFWVGGSWGWTGVDWAWYPGRWLVAPEGRVYIEPYYERVGPNVVYVRGYWGAPGAPIRSYGGERIRFAEVARPVDYRPGEPPRIVHRSGFAPGARPASFYVHASGPARPLPRASAPLNRPGPHEQARSYPGGEPRGVGPSHGRPIDNDRLAPHGPMAPREMPAAHGPPPQHAGPGPAPKRRK